MSIKIIVDNGSYDLLNMGDVAMLQVAVSRLHHLWPQAQIYVITYSPERLAQYCPDALPLEFSGRLLWVRPWNLLGFLHRLLPNFTHESLRNLEANIRMEKPEIVRKWVNFRFAKNQQDLNCIHSFLDLLTTADLVIASGGGYITDAFEEHSARLLETLRISQSGKAKVALLGQGIGPVTKPRLQAMMKKTLPKFDLITLRERRVGVQLLSQLGVSESRCRVTGDDAIELAHKYTPEHLGNAIGVNIRLASYSKVASGEIEQLGSKIQEFSKRWEAPILSIPISLYPNESDCESFQQLMKGIPKETPQPLDSPQQVLEQVNKCRVVITGSYHAGVFALSQGISVVGLAKSTYYLDKFNGLADQFVTGCYVVSITDTAFAQKLEENMTQAWFEASNQRNQLLKKAKSQIQESQTAYNHLYSLVTGD